MNALPLLVSLFIFTSLVQLCGAVAGVVSLAARRAGVGRENERVGGYYFEERRAEHLSGAQAFDHAVFAGEQR